MTVDLRPWQRLLPIWLPAVALCLGALVLYVWQTSESGGRRAQVRDRVVDLEAELARLEGLMQATGGDRAWVAEIEKEFTILHEEVFGTLDGRLTDILRAVGSATRDAGLLPGSYSYSASVDKDTGFIRFGIQFSVEGEYRQIRQMLAELQSSPEFLVVEGLSLTGDEDPISQKLKLAVRIATFLVEADPQQLRRLTGGVAEAAGSNDG
jgi:Tfp pilus assembly protein PilO